MGKSGDGYRFKTRGIKHCHMILQFIEEYNIIEIEIAVMTGIGAKVEIFFPDKKKYLYFVVQAVGANPKFPLHSVNSAYNSRGSSGHCSYPVSVAKCYRNSETRSISTSPR